MRIVLIDGKRVCGAWMPLIEEYCARPPHSGDKHRSTGYMKRQRAYNSTPERREQSSALNNARYAVSPEYREGQKLSSRQCKRRKAIARDEQLIAELEGILSAAQN